MSALHPLPALLILTAFATSAAAQIGPYTATTLEVYVDQADLILRAKATRIDTIPGAQNPAFTKTTTLAVAETLKGDPVTSLTFACYDLQLQSPQAEYLYFFKKNPDCKANSTDPATAHPFQCAGIMQQAPVDPRDSYSVLSHKGYFTTDLRLLEKPEDILAAVRAEAARNLKSKTPDALRIGLPTPVIARAGRSGDGTINYLVMPVDERLETLARRMILHPEEIYTASDYPPEVAARLGPEKMAAIVQSMVPLTRAQGASALKPFKSDANIALLKSLLTDTSIMIVIDPGQTPDQGRRVYHVRTAAFEVLQSWTIPLEKPLLEDPTPKP